MKLIVTLVLFSTLFLFSGCEKITQFYLEFVNEVVIQDTQGSILPIDVITPETTTNSSAEFENHDTDKDHIESIHLKELVLDISHPPNKTFSFLNSVEIFISSPSHSRKRISYKSNISNDVGGTLFLNVENIDLQKFIAEDSFTLEIEATTDETLSEDVHINVYSKFFVDAKVFK